jgi:Zn-dependent protease with chaperone function
MNSLTALAQFESSYTPAQFQDTIPQEVSDHLKTRLAAQKKALSADKVSHRNFILSLYEQHTESLVKYFNEDYFIVNDELTTYLQSVLMKILQSNPQLQDQITIYAHRSSSPNAFTFWDGTIGVTLGLLARMENEDEVAFVLCHELAHYYSNHIGVASGRLQRPTMILRLKRIFDR